MWSPFKKAWEMSENYRLPFRVSVVIRRVSGMWYVLSRYYGRAGAWRFLQGMDRRSPWILPSLCDIRMVPCPQVKGTKKTFGTFPEQC